VSGHFVFISHKLLIPGINIFVLSTVLVSALWGWRDQNCPAVGTRAHQEEIYLQPSLGYVFNMHSGSVFGQSDGVARV